jgi:hypothetical protein
MKFAMAGKQNVQIIIVNVYVMVYFSSIILDADATSVVQRVALRTDDIPLGEQTVAQVTFYSFLLILNPLFIYLFFSTQFTQLLFRFM